MADGARETIPILSKISAEIGRDEPVQEEITETPADTDKEKEDESRSDVASHDKDIIRRETEDRGGENQGHVTPEFFAIFRGIFLQSAHEQRTMRESKALSVLNTSSRLCYVREGC